MRSEDEIKRDILNTQDAIDSQLADFILEVVKRKLVGDTYIPITPSFNIDRLINLKIELMFAPKEVE